MNHMIQNRYQVETTIGSGGMGTVYRCLDTQTNEKVALKELNREAVRQDPALLERFAREGEALKLVAHPNIVQVKGTFTENDTHYLVMEYVPGGSLKDLVEREEPISIKRVLEISLGICDALTRAHYMGIVHRDIKPANVLIDLDGSPRLTDFGIALMVDRETITKTDSVVGTLEYIPPEILKGEPTDLGADMWSLGVLIYEMLTSQRPFISDGSMAATMMAIISQPVPDLHKLRPETPDELVNLVMRLLDKDHTQRPAQIRQIGLEIDTLLRALHGHKNLAAARFAENDSLLLPHQQDNLPEGCENITGRDRELEVINDLFNQRDKRLITIVGPVETGKTALALAAASHEKARFPHGTWFVELGACKTVSDAVAAISAVVNLPQKNVISLQALQDFLKYKTLLLVLDHCQQIEMIDKIIQRILDSAPGVRCIVTSRQALDLPDETVLDPGYVKRKEATQILQTGIEGFKRYKNVLTEREYQFVRAQVDSGVLHPTDEFIELIRASKRESLKRHLVYRGFAVFLSSILIVISGILANVFQVSGSGGISENLAANLIVDLVVGIIINESATIFLTILEHRGYAYWKRFRGVLLSMGFSTGIFIALLRLLGIGAFSNVLSAFIMGAMVGTGLGGILFFSVPRHRHRTWWQQLGRSFIVGLLAGVGLAGLVVSVSSIQGESMLTVEDVRLLWFQIPISSIAITLAFSLGIEISNRMLLGPPASPES